MDYKSFKAKLADGEEGAFSANFASFNVIDLDEDVTVPGAFADGEAVRIAQWAHDWNAPPVGRGALRVSDTGVSVDGKFFLDTTHGLDHYRTVKGLGELQEWSYGFDILESEPGTFEGQKVRFLKRIKVHEVSPVLLGAGIGTHTEGIKGPLAFQSETLVKQFSAWAERVKARAEMRGKEGRTLSAANRALLATSRDQIEEILNEIEKLLAETEPKGAVDVEAIRREALRFEALRFATLR